MGVSVFEAISSFERVSGKKLNYRVTNRREGDIEQIWADPSYANMELGWKTELSLDDAMKSAWEWEKHYRTKKPNNEKNYLNNRRSRFYWLACGKAVCKKLSRLPYC